MSTVTFIPETHELEGEDAMEVLRASSWGEVLKRSFVRFRKADGFSFARSLAFQVVLTAIPGAITLVAGAVLIGDATLQKTIEEVFRSITPGPAGDLFTAAFDQAEDNAGSGLTPLVAGGLATAIAGITAMAQLQRGASRIYGIDGDRPTLRRYAVATGLALSVGLALTIAFLLLSFGGAVGQALFTDGNTLWSILRWPLGALVLAGAIAALFKFAPNRHQPAMSWLLVGGAMAAFAWFLASVLLTLYLNASSSFGDTYGPLAGFIGLMLWAQLTGIAVLFGMAFAAQLEGERVGVEEPAVEKEQPSLSDFLAGRDLELDDV